MKSNASRDVIEVIYLRHKIFQHYASSSWKFVSRVAHAMVVESNIRAVTIIIK